MRRLNIFQRVAGDVVELRVKPNSNFVTYVVFLRQHTLNGHRTVSNHVPGPNGEIQLKFTLQPCQGYDLIFTGVVAPSGGASIRYEISFNAALTGNLSKAIPISNSVPSVGWTVLL